MTTTLAISKLAARDIRKRIIDYENSSAGGRDPEKTTFSAAAAAPRNGRRSDNSANDNGARGYIFVGLTLFEVGMAF